MTGAMVDLELETPGSGEGAMPWYVIVQRLDMKNQPLRDYAVGPYETEELARREMNSDIGMTYALLTIEAKAENYQAHECFMTQDIGDALVITPFFEDM